MTNYIARCQKINSTLPLVAEELKDKELISTGKYEEIMLEGFRGDIIYGLNPPENYD